jgi:hypothetical protein
MECVIQEATRHQSSFDALKVNDHDELSGSLCAVSDRYLDEGYSELNPREFYFGSDISGGLTYNRITDTAHFMSPPKKSRLSFSAETSENCCDGTPTHSCSSGEDCHAISWLLDRCGGDVGFLREVWHTFCHQGQIHLNSMRSAMYENDLRIILFNAVSFAVPPLSQTHSKLNGVYSRIFLLVPHVMSAPKLWSWLHVIFTSRLQRPLRRELAEAILPCWLRMSNLLSLPACAPYCLGGLPACHARATASMSGHLVESMCSIQPPTSSHCPSTVEGVPCSIRQETRGQVLVMITSIKRRAHSGGAQRRGSSRARAQTWPATRTWRPALRTCTTPSMRFASTTTGAGPRRCAGSRWPCGRPRQPPAACGWPSGPSGWRARRRWRGT